MNTNTPGWDDTIVSLATPQGIGAIGLIRLSGKRAMEIINALFPSKDLAKAASHTLHVGLITSPGGEAIDEVVVAIYKNPRSYTGEDVIEISCHGSPFVQQQVIAACLQQGARLARAGEFTQRAFLNGKLDLTQAEAVADLIASNTSASQRSALHNIRGGFSELLKELREELIQFSALIELELDFSQEDVEFADRDKLKALIQTAYQTTSRLVSSFKLGNVIKNGVSVAIIGKPNAGKSTLLNSLLNENRAIVSEIAGTTRDTIEETLNIDGILFRLIDTAGIRENSQDLIELAGMERSRQKIKASDELVYIFDVNTESPADVDRALSKLREANPNCLLVGNKTDVLGLVKAEQQFADRNIIFIAAKENTGIDQLKTALVNKIVDGAILVEDTIITNTRHYEALVEVERSLNDINNGLEERIPGDLIALDIRRCLHFISTITGDITNEDVLDHIFSKFCIGK